MSQTVLAASNPSNYGYRVQLTATDPSGASAQGIFQVNINVAPTAPAIPNQTIKSAVAWSYTVPAFTDANGDGLTYSASGLPAGLAFTPSTRVISGSPTTAGTYTVTVTANDGQGGVTGKAFTITVQANTAPTAPAIPNQVATTGIAFSYLVPAFSDANGDALTYTATGIPPGLALSSRTISGTPTTAGTYTVTITANDGRGGTVSKAFTITVANQPPPNRAPVVSAPLPDKWTLGTNYFDWTFPVGTFTDPDNNPLTYTASGQPAWLLFDAANRRFHGAPGDGSATQVWTITVTARDPAGLTVSDAFELVKEGTGGGGGGGGGGGTQPLGTEPVESLYSFDMGTGEISIGEPGFGELEPIVATTTTPIPYQTTEHWYTYDAENRLRINNGKLVDGQIVVDASNNESHELLYDAAGRVVARYRQFNDGNGGINAYVYRSAYDLRGNKTLEFHPEKIGTAPSGIARGFSYTATGTLTETRSYYAAGTVRDLGNDQEGTPLGTLDISGWLEGAEQLTYDSDGRLLEQITKHRTTTNWYQLSRFGEGSTTNQRTDLTALENRSAVYYSTAAGASGYDTAGRATTYRYNGADIGWATHTYTTTYEGWDSYQEKEVTGSSSNTTYKTTTNTLSYDAQGRLTSQREHTDYQTEIDDRIRYYAYNGEGRVQLRRAGTMDGTTFVQEAATDGSLDNALFVHAGGQQQAELKPGGQIRMNNGGAYNTAQLQSLGGSGGFDAGGGKVTVQAGETLSTLAQRIYGSSQRWYVLADANGLSNPDQALVAGTQLNAPSVNVSSNDAGTFKPYNPGEAIGSTSPGLPFIPPPPKNQCSTIAMVLMIVVAVVVTYFTAGAAATYFAPAGTAVTGSLALSGALVASGALTLGEAIAVGFIAGAVGSIASQAVGSALGVASFSWRSALVSGAATAATAGLAGAAQAGKLTTALSGTGKAATAGRAAASAVAGQATSYAASRALGLEASFSWKSIAASAVGAALTANIGGVPLADGGTSTGSFINDFAGGLLNGAITSTTRRVLGLGKQDWRQIAIDAFGNALGNAAVRGIETLSSQIKDRASLSAEDLNIYKDAKRSGLTHEQAMVKAVVRDGMFSEVFSTLLTPVDDTSELELDKNLSPSDEGVITPFDGPQELTKVGRRVKQLVSVVNEIIGDKLSLDTAESFFSELNRITEVRTFRNEIDANVYFAAIGLVAQEKLGVEVNANLISDSVLHRVVDFNHGIPGVSGEVETVPFDSSYFEGWRLSGVMHTHPGTRTFSGAWQDRFNFITNSLGDTTIAWSKKVDAFVARPDFVVQKFNYSDFAKAPRPPSGETVYAYQFFENL